MLHKEKMPLQFRAVASDSTLVLEIYDYIGADMFGEGITASMVSDALKDPHDDITVRINSGGGDAFEGIAINNILRSSGKPVNVIVDGLAASAASIIAMAGDTIQMSQGSVMMLHNAMSICAGFSDDMRKMADTLDKVSGSIADVYAARTGNKKQAILDMMAEETWLDAKEAVAKGFADSIVESPAIENKFDLSMYRNVPQSLKNAVKTKDVDGEHLTAEDFIYVGNPHDVSTWTLPWHFSTEESTKNHLRDALARFDQDKIIPESHRAEAHAKLVRIAKEHGIDVGGETKNEAAAVENKIESLCARIDLLRKQWEMNKRK